MNPVAKTLILAGACLIAAGIFWQVAGRHLRLGRLPGDLAIERDNFRFYFPLATSIILSVVLSLLMALFGRLTRK